jgi:hypothetical protein
MLLDPGFHRGDDFLRNRQLLMPSQKVLNLVTPSNAGVLNVSKILDTGFRRYDGKVDFLTFHEYARIMFEQSKKLDSALNRISERIPRSLLRG